MVTTTLADTTKRCGATLYRRPKQNFFKKNDLVELGVGPNRTHSESITYSTPGWLAFDFAADVAYTETGNLALGRLELYVDGILRWTARGAYTWTRVYVFVDEGAHTFEWRTDANYKADQNDQAYLRYMDGTAFELVTEAAAVVLTKPPKPTQSLTRFETLDGYERFQQSGFGGTEIPVELTFAPRSTEDAAQHYSRFASEYINFYMIRCRYGLYGGAFIDELAPSHKGPLIIATATLNCAHRPGMGVVGA